MDDEADGVSCGRISLVGVTDLERPNIRVAFSDLTIWNGASATPWKGKIDFFLFAKAGLEGTESSRLRARSGVASRFLCPKPRAPNLKSSGVLDRDRCFDGFPTTNMASGLLDRVLGTELGVLSGCCVLAL